MQSLPFGKVVLLKLQGMDENNCYERHRQIDMARYDLNLKGYMMRAASQYMREWSRVSREAARRVSVLPTLQALFHQSIAALSLSKELNIFLSLHPQPMYGVLLQQDQLWKNGSAP
jgi:hypothetical protein